MVQGREIVSADNTVGPFVSAARHLGKRARTRARLMDTAAGLFAREGFEATSVNEIARLAGVANGTFYAHFKDKDEIAAAVAFGIANDVVRQLDEVMIDIDDAVERTSLATRRFIELASSNPDWGWALFRAVWTFKPLRSNVVNYLREDLKRGVKQGAFKVEIDNFLIETFSSMTMSALFGRLRGDSDEHAGSRVAELQLRMLGVPARTAHKVAWRAIEPVSLRITPTPKPVAVARR